MKSLCTPRLVTPLAGAVAGALFACFAASADARPLPVSPTLVTPPPAGYRIFAPAFEGDWMVVAGGALETSPGSESPYSTAAAFLYRRSGLGPWVLQRKLAEVPYYWDWNTTGVSTAMENGLLAFELDGRLHVYERANSYAQGSIVEGPFDSSEIEIDGGRILVGTGLCQGAAVVEKNAQGVWAISGRLATTTTNCGFDDYSFTDRLTISGDYAFVATRNGSAGPTQAFRRVSGQVAWTPTAALPANDNFFVSTEVALRGPLALAAGNTNEGTRIFRRGDGSGTLWNRVGTLLAVDGLTGSRGHVGNIRQRNELWLLDDNLWRQNTDNSFEHLARFERGVSDVGGRTAVGATLDGIATYVLPATFTPSPAPFRDDFQGGGNITWEYSGNFTVAQSGNTRVFRSTQPSATTDALIADSDWANHFIQADVKPTAFNGTSFVGLTARRTDANNFYQVRVGSNRVALLRRTQAQGDVELAAATVPIAAGTSYRLRFETRDAILRVLVDGAAVISVEDRALRRGSAGLIASRTLADFDNVIVSPLSTTLAVPFDLASTRGEWTDSGGTWVADYNATPRARRQTVNTAAARSITGVASTDDQIVESIVRITSLPPDGDRWVGLIARYRDNSNLYYASLRVNGGLQIRRVVNGAATVLASAPLAVVGNRNYRVRLEVVGDQLRAYVDGALLAEAHDSAIATGRFGLATNRAAATFTELNAYQP